MFCLHSRVFRIEFDFLKRVSILDHNSGTERPELAAF